MKNLHKKISGMVLAGMIVVGGVLSQGFVAHANSSLLKDKSIASSMEEIRNRMFVVGNEDKYKYDSIYLEEVPKEKQDLEYNDRWALKKGLENKVLDKYRFDRRKREKEEDPIIVRVGKSYFKFFFGLSDHQRKVIPIKELGKQYGFEVVYAHSNDSIFGRAEMDSYIINRLRERRDFHGGQALINKLLKRPSEKGINVFSDGEEFAGALKLKKIDIPNGFSRYSIGDYDYIFKK